MRWLLCCENALITHEFIRVFIFFTLKMSDELWLCINYRDLNVITIKNCYSLSLISELLNYLYSFIIFSKIDLKWTYHYVRICKDDEWKTAFCSCYSHYEYLIVLFELTNASATLLEQLLQSSTCLITEYLRNIIIIVIQQLIYGTLSIAWQLGYHCAVTLRNVLRDMTTIDCKGSEHCMYIRSCWVRLSSSSARLQNQHSCYTL